MKQRVKKCFKSACLWVKEYQHALRVIGGVFLALAFFAVFIWVAGIDVEAIAVLLSMISSLFFASPSIATFFFPDRKPIKEMSYQEILEFIPTTDPKNDWQGISRDFSSEMFLKEDPRLRFRARFTEDGIQNEDFKEPWANCHPNEHATGYWYDLCRDGDLIDRLILVSVDGGRALIPPPSPDTGKISEYHYIVAKIHDSSNLLDEYLRRSHLEREHTDAG